MHSTPKTRLDLLLKLIAIPSVTESKEEDNAAQFIYTHLTQLEYFKNNPEHIKLIPTPLERDPRPLHTVFARVMAKKPTKRTVILIGHYDVVEVSMYGKFRHLAFSPTELAAELQKNPEMMSARGFMDLKSGNYLFGRGSMDMKCGLAIEMELLRDFAANQDLFDVNLIMIAVSDEENSSAGMRGAVAELVHMQEEEKLEYICAINTEPNEPGRPGAKNQILFTGTVGKLMPVFLCIGQESHVGNYYMGLSAPLIAATIIKLAEANPDLADPAHENTCPSWICLGNKILREGYSVTVPNQAVVYFNCFCIRKTPAQVMQEMLQIAKHAASETLEQIKGSSDLLLAMGYANGQAPDWQLPVVTVAELANDAIKRLGSAQALASHLQSVIEHSKESDLRDLAIAALQEIFLLSGRSGPMIIAGFLPPYYPPRTNDVPGAKFDAVQKAVEAIINKANECYNVTIEQNSLFAGICDLSYMGFQGTGEELAAFKENVADQHALYMLPTDELTKLDVPIINLGPCGYDAHKLEERLELTYSLDILPQLITYGIKKISEYQK